MPENFIPINPVAMHNPDIYRACRLFAAHYAVPRLDSSYIVQGWQNFVSPPAGTDEYAVIAMAASKQHGATIETFNPDTGRLLLQGLVEVEAQVDFCANSDIARQRARSLSLIACSSVGVDFFKQHGLSLLRADEVREVSFVNEAKQFVRRYRATLRLSINEGLLFEQDYFTTITPVVENVDAHHHPR